MEYPEDFGLSYSALLCPAGDIERLSKRGSSILAVAKIVTLFLIIMFSYPGVVRAMKLSPETLVI